MPKLPLAASNLLPLSTVPPTPFTPTQGWAGMGKDRTGKGGEGGFQLQRTNCFAKKSTTNWHASMHPARRQGHATPHPHKLPRKCAFDANLDWAHPSLQTARSIFHDFSLLARACIPTFHRRRPSTRPQHTRRPRSWSTWCNRVR